MTAWTEAEITSIRTAVAKGLLTVEYDGRRVTYQSLSEMRELLTAMESTAESTTVGGARIGRVYTTFTRE